MRKTKFSRILSVVLVCMLTLSALSVAFSASAATYVQKTETVDNKNVEIVGIAGEYVSNNLTAAKVMLDGNTYGAGANGYWGSNWTNVKGTCGDIYITFDLGKFCTVTALTVYHRADVLFLHMGDYAIYVTDEAPVYDATKPTQLPTGLPTTPSATGTVAKPTTAGPVVLSLDNGRGGRYVTLYVKNLADKTHEDSRALQIAEFQFDVSTDDDYTAPVLVEAEDVTVIGISTDFSAWPTAWQTSLANMFDNNRSTAWQTAWQNTNNGHIGKDTNAYLTFDLGYSQTVTAIEVAPLNDVNNVKYFFANYAIYVSDEAPVYDTTDQTKDPTGLPNAPVGTGTLSKLTTVDPVTLELSEPATGRYVTLYMKDAVDTTADHSIQITEVEIVVEHKPYAVVTGNVIKTPSLTCVNYNVTAETYAGNHIWMDGNLDTFWRSNNGAYPIYITFDLGKIREVTKVDISPNANGFAQFFGDYEFYLTDEAPVYSATRDGSAPSGLSAEDMVLSGEVQPLSSSAAVTFTFPENSTGRYITLHAIDQVLGWKSGSTIKYNYDDPSTETVENDDNPHDRMSFADFVPYVKETAEDVVTVTNKLDYTTSTSMINMCVSGGYDVDKLNDGDTETAAPIGNNAFCALASNGYLTIDMGEANASKNLDEIKLYVRNNAGQITAAVKDYEIFVSDTAPTYSGRGSNYNPGPAPTGLPEEAAVSGTLAVTTTSDLVRTIELPEGTKGRYVTLHIKSAYNSFIIISELEIFATESVAKTEFDNLEIDYATGKVVMPETPVYTATIASSSNTDVVALDGTANVWNGGISNVILKIEFNDGTIAYTAPITVSVGGRAGGSPAATIGATRYDSLDAALKEVKTDETIVLRNDAETDLLVLDGFKVDLNGKSLTAGHVIAFKNSAVIDSKDGGKLVVAKDNVVLNADNDGFLPVYNADGYYTFTTVSLAGRTMWKEAEGQYIFAPKFEATANAALAAGADKSAVKVVLRLTWVEVDEVEGGYAATQDFVYDDVFVKKVIESYGYQAQKQEDGLYALAYTGIDDYGYCFDAKLTRTDVDATELAISAVLISDTGVEIASAATPFETAVEA